MAANDRSTAEPDSQAGSVSRLEQVRRVALGRSFWPLVLIGTISALGGSLSEFSAGRYTSLALYLVLLGCCIVAAVGKSIDYRIRVGILISAFYILALYELLIFGVASLADVSFLMVAVFSAVFLSKRVTMVLIGLCLVAIAVVGIFYVAGAVPIVNEQQAASMKPLVWVAAIATTALLSFLVFILLSVYSETLEVSLRGEEQTIERLRAEVAERRQIELALRESENSLRESQVIAGLGSYVLNVATGIWTSSSVLDRVFGIDTSYERSVNGWTALIHPADRQRMVDHLNNDVIGQGGVFDREYRILRHDDQAERWVHGLGKLEFDDQGHALKMHGTIQDVTEQKRAAEALRESEERYRTVADFTYDWEYWLSPEGRFIYCSPACERMTGYRAEEFERDPSLLSAIVHPDDREWFDLHINSTEALAHDSQEQELRIVTRSGEARWVSHACRSVYGRDGTYRGRRASNRDITERKQAEAERERLETQLQQAQKMEAVGQLAGGVAHDFNNMLGVILGYTQMAIENCDSTQPIHEMLQEVQKATQRSADLTRQLLAFARKQTISPRILDLNATVAGMIGMLSRLIGENIVLNWQPGHNVWPTRIDPVQVDQILANLLLNARDAIDGAGVVTIATANVAQDNRGSHVGSGGRAGNYVLLTVHDTGKGMDKETLGHVFEPFFTTKSLGQGTGLGLATVYGIVKQNDGLVTVSSAPGQGTTFNVYLPRCKAEADVPVAGKSARSAQTGNETILLVEDEKALLKLAKNILVANGYTVLATDTPAEAIDLAKRHGSVIHLLITDVVMPEMNGQLLMTEVTRLRGTIKTLFMSGYTADVIAQHGVLESSVHFIQKPFTPEGLCDKVRSVLDA